MKSTDDVPDLAGRASDPASEVAPLSVTDVLESIVGADAAGLDAGACLELAGRCAQLAAFVQAR
ncbi:hypothetical protein, partial [Spelaeicoccus albus]